MGTRTKEKTKGGRDLDLDRYRALLCAIETGSLSAAAEELNYTPSGISRMLAALEEEHGFPLLIRGRSGVTPTSACEELLPAMRELLFAGERLSQLSDRLRGLDTGNVVVGTAYSAFYAPLSRIISDFHRRYPGIQVQIAGGYSTELLEKLNTHELDLCIISHREGPHQWLPVCEDHMTAWVPAGHPLAELPAFPVEKYAEEPYIETYPGKDVDNVRVLARCRVKPNLRFSTSDSLATYSMVEAGLGVSMNNALNGRSWSGSVRILPLDPPQPVEVGAAFLQDISPAAGVFLDYFRSSLDSLTAEIKKA